MADTTDTQESADFKIEQRFLEELDAPDMRFDELAGMLSDLHNGAQYQRRDDCYLILQKKLEVDRNFGPLLRLVKMRAGWLGNSIAYGQECHDVLVAGSKDRLTAAIVESAGFGTQKPLDCIRKIENLIGLVPGTGCYDATWGFGIVRKVDDFYKRVIVDFDRKPGHTMLFSYASDALRPVSPDHVLAVRHADPAKFAEMCENEPGKVVLMTLSSFGSMSASRLEIVMTGGVLPPETDWRSFWSKARAQLKGRKDVKIPPVARKNDPITFVESIGTVGDSAWFSSLAALNDVEELLSRMQELKQAAGAGAVSDEGKSVLRDRIGFVLKACATTHDNKEKVRTILAALDFGFESVGVKLRKRHDEEFAFRESEGTDAPKSDETEVLLAETLRIPSIVMDAAAKLPSSMLDAMVARIPLDTDGGLASVFAEKIPEMPYPLLERAVPKILGGSARDDALSAIKRAFADPEPPYAVLFWVCRNRNREEICELVPAAVVMTAALLSLEPQVSGENLRLQHQIAKCFTDQAWLFSMFAGMDDYERGSCFERIKSVDGEWTAEAKRRITSQIAAKYPGLLSEEPVSAPPREHSDVQRVTSWRSYNERKEKYRNLVEVEIPQNSRDIEIARGYGDLRENFEYQTAKDHQRVLLQRQAELSADLDAVKPTDFSDFVFDGKAGIGTTVSVAYPSGAVNRYHILGEWDSDPESGIIPSRSRLAVALSGHAAGDIVDISDETGTVVSVVLKSVEPLSENIKKSVSEH